MQQQEFSAKTATAVTIAKIKREVMVEMLE